MAVLVSPGVLTREIDLSLYIPALTSTIVGMVGTATRGLTDVAALITDVSQLAKTFGNPSPDHPAILTAQWYLKFGRQLWFTRVANQDVLATATTDLGSGAAGAASVVGANTTPFSFAAATAASVTGSEVGPFNISSGVNDKLKIAVDLGGDQTVTLTAGAGQTTQDVVDDINAGTTGLTASVTVDDKVKLTSNTTGSSSSIQIKTIANDAYTDLGLTVATTSGTAGTNVLEIQVDGGSSQFITLTAGSRTATQVQTDINATLTGAAATVASGAIVITSTSTGILAEVQVMSASTADTVLGLDNTLHAGTDAGATSLTIDANTPGSWGNDLTVTVADGTISGTKTLTVKLQGFVVEVWRNLSKTTSSARYWETLINGNSEYISITDDTGVVSQPANTTNHVMAGGDDGLSGIADGDYIGEVSDSGTTGLQNYVDPNTRDINLIVVPGQSSMNIHAAMLSLVSSRADAMAILDPPSGLTPTQAVDFRTAQNSFSSRVALDSNRGAMYYPWLKAYDPHNRVVVNLPPSAGALRSYIYNDTVAQLWFAPMGVNRGLIPEAVGIERIVTEGEKDYLYENNINSIMSYHNYGITIMGEKTLQTAPTTLDRVNVRRMMDYLHKVVVTVTFPLIGEPNTPRLWRRLVALLQPHLQYLKDQEGVTAYQIVCDSSTNPQNLVNAHEVHAKIGILPTPDAEFIYTDFVLVDSMATFQEYLAPAA